MDYLYAALTNVGSPKYKRINLSCFDKWTYPAGQHIVEATKSSITSLYKGK